MNAREIRQAELEGEIEFAQQALQTQMNDYKDKGGNALIILGIMVSAYALYRLITSSSTDDEPKAVVVKKESNNGFLNNAFIGLVSSVVLGVAKDQILGFIKEKIHENKNE